MFATVLGFWMANKQNFTPEEWTKLLQSTMLVGIAVSAADPSGLWGTLKEAAAGSSAVVAAKRDAGSNELVRAVASDFETSRGRSDVQSALKVCFADAHPADCVQRSLANLREVSAILDTKAPADAAAFKAWLRGISEKVAEAAAEGPADQEADDACSSADQDHAQCAFQGIPACKKTQYEADAEECHTRGRCRHLQGKGTRTSGQ